MNRLQDGIQLIIQAERQGYFECRAFIEMPNINPSYIVLVGDGTSDSLKLIRKLELSITREITHLNPRSKKSPTPPCGGNIDNCLSCHANQTTNCKRLLILVGGNNDDPLPPTDNFDNWLRNKSYDFVIPVLHRSKEKNLRTILRKPFAPSNAVFYDQNISEVSPAILSSAGLTSDEHKVFISYRRKDSEYLAKQLFDGLTYEGFDVFLDRFSVPPGVDFQRKLTAELADKAMLVVIESATFQESEWTMYEIDYAIKHRLGLFAVTPLGGKALPSISENSRARIRSIDFKKNKKKLKKGAVKEVVRRIIIEHGRKLIWRSQVLHLSMENSLYLQGIRNLTTDNQNFIILENGGTRYSINLTTRPPSVKDFLNSSKHSVPNSIDKPVIVGPISSQDLSKKKELLWLSGVSKIFHKDEGQMKKLAKHIARNNL